MFKFIVNNGANQATFQTQAEGQIWYQKCFAEGTPLRIVDATAEYDSQQALEFLNKTDWKVIRHRDQIDSGAETSISNEEYQELLKLRQNARNKVL